MAPDVFVREIKKRGEAEMLHRVSENYKCFCFIYWLREINFLEQSLYLRMADETL